jgi:transposase
MSEKELNGASGRIAERAVGERSDLAAARPAREGAPDPELVERAKRRRFTAEYKLRILGQAEACTRPGEIGALLRREGLYTSHLTAWRKQRDAGALEALDRKRGRKPADRRDAENAALRRRLERAEAELEKARKVIEVQGNVSALLGELLEPRGAKPDGSSGR